MTEAEYLLICNLLYNSEFFNQAKEGWTVAQILADGVNTSGDSYTTSQEHKDIIELASKTPSIANLTIQSIYSDDTQARAACFVTPQGEAIVAFRGTGEYEWPDNVQGANTTATAAQKNALNWVNSLGYDNIVATGHSKGGNKAMFVAVTSSHVSQCYSFDGQGFGPEFISKYSDEIANMQGKMHSISHCRDFVNILLYDITGNPRYVANNVYVNGLAEYHTPNALFKYEWVYNAQSGEWQAKPVLALAPSSTQSALMKGLSGFVGFFWKAKMKKIELTQLRF